MCNWDADLEFIDLAGGNELNNTVNSSQNYINQIDNSKKIGTSQTASILLGANYKSQTCMTVNAKKFPQESSQKEVLDDFCDSANLKIEFPNDSIASNKS